MDWAEALDLWAAEKWPQLTIKKDEPMERHTSFRIGGPARRMAFPATAEELTALADFGEKHGARPLLLGNGTNVLSPDKGLDRLVIQTAKALNGIRAGEEPGTLIAQAGATLGRLAEFACKLSLTGLEFAHGIPGTVGGGICMNAGAYGGEIKQVLQGAGVFFPGEGTRYLSCEELALSYRHSILSDRREAVVLYGVFALASGEEAAIRQTMRELMERRRATQPLEWPSAGSTFKRPEGHFAGTLIDQCGLKGLTVGGAQVSEKHAGFVINHGGATFADVTELMARVQRQVREATGVTLEPEVKILE